MPNLGNKYECYNCEAKFYDLGKPEPICPKCQANQNDAESSEEGAPEVDAETLRRTRTTMEEAGDIEVQEQEGLEEEEDSEDD